jgi:hypothetical protein
VVGQALATFKRINDEIPRHSTDAAGPTLPNPVGMSAVKLTTTRAG